MGIINHSSNNTGWSLIASLGKAVVHPQLGVRRALLACFALEAVAVGMGAMGPFALKLLVDGLTERRASIAVSGGLVAIFIVGSLGAGIVAAWRRVHSQEIIDRLNAEIVDDSLGASMPELAGARTGDSGRTLSLIERLPYSLQIVVEGLIWQAAPMVLQVAISLSILASLLKPVYVVVLVLTLTAFVFCTWYSAIRQHAVGLNASAAASHLSETVGDVLRNARRVVLNGALNAERKLIRQRFAERQAAFRHMLSSQVMVGLLQYGAAGLGLSCLLTLGAGDVLSGKMTVGDFVLLQAYGFSLVLPLSGFGFVISQAAIAFINIRDMLNLGQSRGEESINVKPPEHAAEIVLRDVGFSYGVGLPGIHGVNATIPPGTFTVIVGPNGSGKSTLAQIMAGILEPDAGDVLVDNRPLRDVPPAQRYRFLLYVPQAVTLMNRSLLDNALYPPTGQSEAELARLLAEWRFYDPAREIDFSARVGEQGERLSGGQIQKLELARIARVNAPAIILDESTSALDPVSEAEIIQTLRAEYGARTTLVLITHRKSLAETADQVLFMKNGTILRAGKHETLMRDSAAYVRLWEGVRGASKGAGPNPKV